MAFTVTVLDEQPRLKFLIHSHRKIHSCEAFVVQRLIHDSHEPIQMRAATLALPSSVVSDALCYNNLLTFQLAIKLGIGDTP